MSTTSDAPGENGPRQEGEAPEPPAGRGRRGRATLPALPALLHPSLITRSARVRAKQALRRRVPGGARHAFRVDLTAMLLAGLYQGAVFPFVAVIAREDLRASADLLALMTAAPFIGNLMALGWARMMEGRRKTPFVLYSHLAARGLIFLSFLAVGAWPFALIVAGCQVVGTIATPAYAAIIKDVYPDDQRGTLLSYSRAAILLGTVVSTLLAGWLIDAVGYRAVFPVAAIVGIGAALVFARIHPGETESPDAASGEGFWARVRETNRYIWGTLGILREDLAYRWFAFSVFTYGFGNLLTVPIIPLIQVDELHIRKGELAVLAILLQFVAIFAYFYWGRYVDRRSPQRAVVVNILLSTAIPLVYILTAVIPGANAWTLLPAFLISGVVMAGIDMSYFSALLTFAGPENVSRYQALQSFLLGIRGSVAPFIGGSMVTLLRARDLDLRWAFGIGMLFMLVGAWMQWVAMRRQEARGGIVEGARA